MARRGTSSPPTTVSSRELNRDIGRAKRAAKRGPVIITDRGRPSHVLLTIDAYNRLLGPTIVELLAMPAASEIELAVPRVHGLYRAADLAD